MGCSSSSEKTSSGNAPAGSTSPVRSAVGSPNKGASTNSKATIGPLHAGAICGIWVDGSRVLTASDDKRLACFTQTTGKQKVKRFEGHVKAVNRVVASGEYAWSVAKDLSILQWKINSEECVSVISENTHDLNITALEVNPAANRIFTGGRDAVVKSWDMTTQKGIQDFKVARNIATDMQLDPIKKEVLYQTSEDMSIRSWDVRTNDRMPMMHIKDFVYYPTCIDIHPDGNLIVVGCKGSNGGGGQIKLYDIRNTKTAVQEFLGHINDVVGCEFAVESKKILSVSKDGFAYLWDYETSITGKPLSTLHLPDKPYLCMSTVVAAQSDDLGSAFVGLPDGSVGKLKIQKSKISSKPNLVYEEYTRPFFAKDESGALKPIRY